jgi:carboxypeptidase PM20D1
VKKAAVIGVAATGIAVGAAVGAVSLAGRSRSINVEEHVTTPPVLEPGIDRDTFLEHLAEAIRLPTVVNVDRDRNDPADILAMHRFLRSSYPLTHEQCLVETVNDLSLLLTWEGTDPDEDPLVLMAHMDVVPVEPGTEEDWAVDAFSGRVVDEDLWGRGTLDDKGPLIAVMEAVEHLLGAEFEPRRTVLIAIGHDEEIGGAEGAKPIADLLRDRGVRPWFVVDEGGAVADAIAPLTTEPVALVKVAEKGYVDLEFTATGDGGHSSVPPGSSAIGNLAKAIQLLEANPMPARVGVLAPFFNSLASRLDPRLRPVLSNLGVTGPVVTRLFGGRPETDAMIRTTTAVTMVTGGVKPNVLPQEASAVANFRILPGDSVESVIEHVRRVVGDDISVEMYGEMHSEPSRFSSTDSSAWGVIQRSIEETFPEAVVAPWILTGATDSRYYTDFAGDIYGFAPFTGGMDMLSSIHGTGERIRVSDAGGAVSFFCRLIRNAQPRP